MPQQRRSRVTSSFGPVGLEQKNDKIDIAEKQNPMKATGEASPWSCSTAASSPNMTPLFEYSMSSPNPWVGQDWTGGISASDICLTDFGKSPEFALPEALEMPEQKQRHSRPQFNHKASGGPSSQLLVSLAGHGNEPSYLALGDNGQGPAFIVPRASQTETSIFGSIFDKIDQYNSILESPAPKEKEAVTKQISLPPGLEDVMPEPCPMVPQVKVKEELPIPAGTVTIMIRNLPNKYTRELLQDRLNEQFFGKYDFLYLPVDFKNRCNMGYAFVNFKNYEDCAECTRVFHGRSVQECLPGYNSAKVCAVSPARVQGCEENVRRLRCSPVMAQLMSNKQWLPQLFGKNGQPIPFPEPDQPLPAWDSGVAPKSRGKGRVSHATRSA